MTADPAERSGSLNGQIDPRIGTAIHLIEMPVDLVAPPPDGFDQHFYDDLGTHSMVVARFCARVRKRADRPSVSMTDVYRPPTISSLALALAEVTGAPVPTRMHTHQYLRCETLQLLIFLVCAYFDALAASQGSQWIFAGSGLLETYPRSDLPREALVGMADPPRLTAAEVTAQ